MENTITIGNHKIELLSSDELHYGFGSNKQSMIKFDGEVYEVILQGMINIWAFAKRPELSNSEAAEFDAFLNHHAEAAALCASNKSPCDRRRHSGDNTCVHYPY